MGGTRTCRGASSADLLAVLVLVVVLGVTVRRRHEALLCLLLIGVVLLAGPCHWEVGDRWR